MTSRLADATTALFGILEPLSEEERLKVVGAVLVLFGQSVTDATRPNRAPAMGGDDSQGGEATPGRAALPAKALRWMRQHGVTDDMLEECFHLDAEVPEVVGTVPGRSAREKTENCYLLTGAAALLKHGEAEFDDSDARRLCEHTGCYDTTNHSKYVKLGNRATGDKKRGWKLLAPGLRDAADLIRQMSAAPS